MHGGMGQRRRPPTELLKGRYELLEILGSGGEARVVKALDHQHTRLVALKLRPVESGQGRDDLLHEARVLLGLTPHPSLPLQGVAPDGRIVVAYIDGGRLFADVTAPRSGAERDLQSGTSSAGCAATMPSFTPDSRLMAIADGCLNVVVWNLQTGRVTRTISLPDRASGSGALLSPDGRYVLVAVLGGAFVRVDLDSGKAIEIPGAQTEGNVLALSPDGRFYAIGRQDGTVDEYDARSLQRVRRHTVSGAVQMLVFSPGSSALAVEDTSHVVWVWDTCAVCENPTRLAQLAARDSVRGLTPGERATFHVG